MTDIAELIEALRSVPGFANLRKADLAVRAADALEALDQENQALATALKAKIS